MKAYNNYNLRLILSMGNPTPEWAAKMSWCILPENDSPEEFEKLADQLASVLSNFVESMWNNV